MTAKTNIIQWLEEQFARINLYQELMVWAREFYGLPTKRVSTAMVVWKPKMKPHKFTERMTEQQFRAAIKDHITVHPGINLPTLMSAMPLPKVKPVCHMNFSYIILDMVKCGEIVEVTDRPRGYTIRYRYYPTNA